jgi:hypothetical protein
MGIIAKEVVDAQHSAHNGAAVGAGGKACQTSLTDTTALLRPSTGCAEIFGHAWDYTTAKRDKGEFIQGLVCIRCGVQRAYRIDSRNGDRLGSGGYDYQNAPGYLLKGGGPLIQEERSELRLLEVRGHGGSRAEACPNDGLARQQKSFVRMQLTVTSWCHDAESANYPAARRAGRGTAHLRVRYPHIGERDRRGRTD